MLKINKIIPYYFKSPIILYLTTMLIVFYNVRIGSILFTENYVHLSAGDYLINLTIITYN